MSMGMGMGKNINKEALNTVINYIEDDLELDILTTRDVKNLDNIVWYIQSKLEDKMVCMLEYVDSTDYLQVEIETKQYLDEYSEDKIDNLMKDLTKLKDNDIKNISIKVNFRLRKLDRLPYKHYFIKGCKEQRLSLGKYLLFDNTGLLN